MTEADYSRKLDELDRLLNDPDVRLEPARVWALLAEMRQRQPLAAGGGTTASTATGAATAIGASR